MAVDGDLTLTDKWKYMRKVKELYVKASRTERGRLLDDLEAILGMHRKSIIRRINSDLKRKPRSRERGKRYGPQVDDALRVIAESFDYICPERLTPNLGWMAQHLAEHGELMLTSQLLDDLERISISTVKRRLKRLSQDEPRLRRKARSPGATQGVPMRRIPWQQSTPGHFEVDTVHHCGPGPTGDYVHTIQMVDVATGWSERFAVLGRSYRVMEHAFQCLLTRLPFPVLEIHPDNGSEFFNSHLVRFWKDKVQGVRLSRSRPYQKNDNRIVEQKNATLVRKYLGYDRLDTVAHTLALNELYLKMGVYYNFFQPVMHMVEKTWTPPTEGQSGQIKRKYDQAKTPLDRLVDTGVIQPEHRDHLSDLRARVNPRQLRRDIRTSINDLFTLPLAEPGQSQNIFNTLAVYPILQIEGQDSVTLSFDLTTCAR